MIRLFYIGLLSVAAMSGAAQNCRLPPNVSNALTGVERAVLLHKVIQDSVSADRYACVIGWAHYVLGLSQGLHNDTLTAHMYRFLADAWYGKKDDSAAFYYRKSLSSFSHITPSVKLYLQQSLLYAHNNLRNRDSILYYIDELRNSVAPLPDTNRRKLIVINSIATCYGTINDYEQEIESLRFVMRHSLAIRDSSTLRNALINTGTTYNEMGNDSLAVYYTMQALPYLHKSDETAMLAYGNLSEYFGNLGSSDSSLYFLKKAGSIAEKAHDDEAIRYFELKIASNFVHNRQFSQAEPLLKQSLDYYRRQEGLNLVNALLLYAQLDTALHRYQRAEHHLLQLDSLTKRMNQQAYRAENLQLLAHVTGRLGKYREAYGYEAELVALNDSIQKGKLAQNLAALQTEYQTYKKQEQINLLQKEAQIKDLEINAYRRTKASVIIIGLICIAVLTLIIYIRSLKEKTALQRLRSELEMKALRSQMNPHFIFNSLNSIQKYIWERRPEDASEYLTNFARLMRLVLENSLHRSVKLNDELHALRLYIEMERRRNNGKFEYEISVLGDIDPDKVFIPPMLLQPYVENAIWHGLSAKEGRGKLYVEVKTSGSSLLCRIDDDGIGRRKSAEYQSDGLRKQSLGMNISSQRIAWLQKDSGMPASEAILDKYEGTEAVGTTVLLTLPITD